MCTLAVCRTCGKATYSGCGQHVEQVLRGVPQRDRCDCPPERRGSGGGSLLGKLFGRRSATTP